LTRCGTRSGGIYAVCVDGGDGLPDNAPAVTDKLSLSDPGNLEYIDRTYRLTSIPAEYVGLEQIQLANNDKAISATNYVTFANTPEGVLRD
jgi:hypothetical protein